MALYSSRLLFIPSLSFSTSLSSFFHSFNNTPSFLLPNSFPISLSSFPSLISSISTSFSLFFFSTSPTSLYFLYISLVIPSFLVSPLINPAPIRGFHSLLLSFQYLPTFSQKTSMVLYSSRLLFILSLSFSTSLFSYFVSYLISPSFLFSRSFATSPSSFSSPISSILTSFSLFFFSLLYLPLYIFHIYHVISFLLIFPAN